MDASQTYILISIIVLLIIALLVVFVKRNKKVKPLTPLAGLAFGFILAGIAFGDDRRVGYSLMGIGVAITIVDIVRKVRKNE
ncbi:hypothetical protein GOV13_01340 [Candidatus Pacearchaeota archaeon]|nr:hypothetical protein [Candidatus Pacearchaeota archaeon]